VKLFRFHVLGCERESSAGATSQRSRTDGTPARGVNVMARARTAHESDCSSPAARCSRALLLLVIAGLLNACGGGDTELNTGPGTGVCVTGPAPAVLTWDPVTNAAGYRVYYGTTSGIYPQSLDAQTATTLAVMGLSSGTTYHFVVTAYDSSTPPNESSFSNAVCKAIS
jgi:hypothetical protein